MIRIKNRKTGKRVIMKLRDGFVEEFVRKPIEEAAMEAKNRGLNELFEIKITSDHK